MKKEEKKNIANISSTGIQDFQWEQTVSGDWTIKRISDNQINWKILKNALSKNKSEKD